MNIQGIVICIFIWNIPAIDYIYASVCLMWCRDTKKIGIFLKELRKEKGLTQEQLAEKLLVSGRTVSRWETGLNMPDLSSVTVSKG